MDNPRLVRYANAHDDSERFRVFRSTLAGIGDPARLAQVGDWIIECATAAALLARVAGTSRRGD